MSNYKNTDADKGDFPFPNYWDMVKYYQQSRASGAYTGWEGFADPFKILKKRKLPSYIFDYLLKHSESRGTDEEGFQIRCDMLFHYLYENLDQGGYLLTQKEIENAMVLIDFILSSRRFKPSGITWKVENGLIVPEKQEEE